MREPCGLWRLLLGNISEMLPMLLLLPVCVLCAHVRFQSLAAHLADRTVGSRLSRAVSSSHV